jgi:hypothetical protein
MKLPSMSLSILALILANVVPLVGVTFFDWDATAIVLLYWAENLVIGFYNILKIAIVKVSIPSLHLVKLLAIPFFCLHFGGFCGGHGLFLLTIFKFGGGGESLFPEQTWPGHLVFLQMLISAVTTFWRERLPGMEELIFSLFISHGISFVQNYLKKKEYTFLTIRELMVMPYNRIAVLQVAVVAGGMLTMMLDSPAAMLYILIFFKICVDVYLHMKEHRLDRRVKVKQPDAAGS